MTTDTWRICVELLGWHVATDEDRIAMDPYRHNYRWHLIDGEPCLFVGGAIPDLTRLDGCRAFEDALLARGLLYLPDEGGCFEHTYIRKLMIVYRQVDSIANYYTAALRATPAQRVAACIAVLEEITK